MQLIGFPIHSKMASKMAARWLLSARCTVYFESAGLYAQQFLSLTHVLHSLFASLSASLSQLSSHRVKCTDVRMRMRFAGWTMVDAFDGIPSRGRCRGTGGAPSLLGDFHQLSADIHRGSTDGLRARSSSAGIPIHFGDISLDPEIDTED